MRFLPVRPRNRHAGFVQLDDALREKVVHRFAFLRHVGCEHMVEAAVLADDHDDVLDRRSSPTLAARRGIHYRGAERQLRERERAEPDAYGAQHASRKILRVHEFPPGRMLLESVRGSMRGATPSGRRARTPRAVTL